jgi:mRNA interferase RelE/StbE
MYQVRLLEAAIRELRSLDKPTGSRIVRRIKWLAENIASMTPKRLTGELSGLCKLREGDYRILYQVLRAERTIIIHGIGHRRDIYRKR